MNRFEENRAISRIQPQPVNQEQNFREMKNAVIRKEETDFQYNPLGGPLNQDFHGLS